MAGILWALASLEIVRLHKLSNAVYGYVALFLFVFFAGTRFETGYDWLAYEETFLAAPSFVDALSGRQAFNFTPMEPLYAILNILVKSIGGDIQSLFFLAAVFNGFVIYWFVKRVAYYPAFCLAFYFCFAYLTGQMTLVRQSLASSFVFLAIIFYVDKKHFKATGFALAALGFHTSVLMFYPLLFFLQFKPKRIWIILILSIGLAVLAFGESIVGFSLGVIKPIFFESMQQKIDEYISLGDYKISIGSIFYIGINFGFLWLSLKVGERDKWSVSSRTLFYLCFMLICSQLFFAQLPVIWNRVQLVAVVAQSCVLSIYMRRLEVNQRFVMTSFSAIFSLVVLSYFLLSPRMEPFIPYQSVLERLFNDGDLGDGRWRLENAIKDSAAVDLLKD